MLDSLSGITAFVQVAETRSFTEAGRLLEISSSAVGKSVARMEERLGVRLFHRSTRSVTLTAEGEMFLERCRRIIQEAEQAEIELSQLAESPRGKLRISVPLQNTLMFPLLSGFMQAYPQIELDVDLSDRMVDVIEEGFDAVIRTGQPSDSRLMSRKLGEYKLELVASRPIWRGTGAPRTRINCVTMPACCTNSPPAVRWNAGRCARRRLTTILNWEKSSPAPPPTPSPIWPSKDWGLPVWLTFRHSRRCAKASLKSPAGVHRPPWFVMDALAFQSQRHAETACVDRLLQSAHRGGAAACAPILRSDAAIRDSHACVLLYDGRLWFRD